MTSLTEPRGMNRGDNFSPGGTLTRMENNTAAILREIDNDRRSTLRNERYGTASTYMSDHQSGTVYIRVSVPELKIQKCLQFELDETVWEAKQRILSFFSKDLKDSLNYGLYLPPMNGRAGKFLEEERQLREYPLHGPIGFLEFKYKRRVYKMIHLNARKLKQLHTKANFRQLLDAVKGGQLSKLQKMTTKGLDPNFHETSTGETPLTYAVALQKDRCREVIISLVSGGAHLDFRTKQGLTPMHKAVLNGNNLAVKTLLDLGASTDYKDSRGLSPLYYSVLYGKNPSCAEQLLHERATIGVRDEQGWYEIHQACKLGLVQHLEHLMFYGADLNVQNASGNTALHICAVNNNEQCTRVLLFRGANKHLYNYNNQTPQQVAIIAGNVALAELIKNHDDKDIVPFRELPTFSSRRPRMSTSSVSLISRSRSDPKLNVTSTIEDATMPSLPGSMRSLPQNYQVYSDSGSYTASRGSDSPRSMSISSNSSGPVNSVSDTGYWEGSIQDREGWFPAHYVQEVRLKNRAGSLDDLLSETRDSTLYDKNTLAALVPADSSDYAPRTVVLQRAPEGYGFVLRGAKSQLKPSGELDFQPTAEFPALQYLDSVDPASVADQAGLKAGDFILEINGENVVRASHDRVVHLIRGTGDTLAMKVVTVRQGSRTPDWFVNQNKSMTLPNKKKKAAPVPPQRDPRTSLSMSRSEGQSMSEELAAMETLDKAIAERRSSEEKTASIRSRTATKRVSCVELDGVDGGGRLERASSTPNLLDKAKKDIIYATPTVPSKGYPSEPSSPTGVTIRPKGPPPPPPQEQTSPRKQAPGPPITVKAEINSSPSEVVVINTKKHSPYATPVMQNKSEDKSHYRSSFRPDEPDNASATLRREQHRTPSPVKHASDSGASSPRDHAEKQNVSFAEDKVYDHAASFLKKHPNARLMITADGAEKARNRNSRLYEPEPDYEIDSGEDSPRNPQSPKPAVTVISIGEKKPAPKPQTQQYTVHSTIPSESSTQNFPIPPRPAGPAPTPPTQKAVAPKAPPSPAPPLPKFSPDHDEIPPPVESFPPPPPPITNSAPPPPPPPPSQVPPPPPPPPSQVEVVKIATTDSLPTITPIPSDIIAAAVQKRQERIAKEGLNIGPPASKPVISVKDSNQAAILAAVAKRREHLDTIGQESVVASIESRLQKTKKLQAAKFSLAGSKTAKKDGDNGVSQGQPFNSSQVSPVTKEIEKKVQASRDTPVKEVNTSSAKELSFTVKTPTSKPSTKIPPKPTNETNVSAKVNRQESLKLKPEPLANAPVTQKTASTETKKEEKTGEIVNGQSDFLALAEKRRQEYLQRKQKSPPGSKTSTPGTSTVGTPEKDKFRSNKIVINSFEKKSTSPPVSAKPKTNGTTKGYTELQSPQGLVKVKPLTSVNGTQKMNERNLGVAPPPPPGFRDDRSVDNTVVQLEIIPPPPSFSSDSGTDMNVQHSPGFSPDTASLVSSLSTLSSLSGDHNDGRSNGYEDLIAPPPPGFDDGVDSFIPPPPEFGSDIGRKTASDFDDKPVEQWLCKDVLDWLDSLKMSQYKESFQTNCIDGKKLLALTRNNYIELGVSQVGHRMNIERSIKKAAAVKQNNNLHDIIASEHL